MKATPPQRDAARGRFEALSLSRFVAGAHVGAAQGEPGAPPASAADRPYPEQCQALSQRHRPQPPLEGGRPRSGTGPLLCPPSCRVLPSPLAADDCIEINASCSSSWHRCNSRISACSICPVHPQRRALRMPREPRRSVDVCKESGHTTTPRTTTARGRTCASAEREASAPRGPAPGASRRPHAHRDAGLARCGQAPGRHLLRDAVLWAGPAGGARALCGSRAIEAGPTLGE